jgi:CubicO group peptidase (beta-lactamase class C family)
MNGSWTQRPLLRLGIVLLMACQVVAPADGAQSQQRAAAARDEIGAAAAREMERAGSPSLQMAASYDGVTRVNRAFGTANVELNVAATTTTRYRTASVAKWFTATEAMRLSAAGRLDLDAPIQAYCPRFPPKRWPVTARQLLTHTSGLRHEHDYERELTDAKTDAERLAIVVRRDREALGRFTRYDDVFAPLVNFADDALLFEPGTDWSYSSPDYRVLSCVLQGAAGKPYTVLMQENIFTPAGMAHTVPDDAWAIVPERAGLYQVDGARHALRHANYRDVSENLAAGGYLSTASDLVAFALRFSAAALIGSDDVRRMLTPVVVTASAPPTSAANVPAEVPSYRRYGYGVMLFPTDTGTWFGHSGRQDGASTLVVVSPDRRCVVAVMMNVRSWANGFDFVRSICSILAQQTK